VALIAIIGMTVRKNQPNYAQTWLPSMRRINQAS